MFKLVSKYKPNGDQPEAIQELVQGIKDGKSSGHSGNYSTNYQINGRELLTPDEVRLLDNRYAILFIRGERPIIDYKYNILKHPNVDLSVDGKRQPFIHGKVTNSIASVNLDFSNVTVSINQESDDDSNILNDYDIVSSKYLKMDRTRILLMILVI